VLLWELLTGHRPFADLPVTPAWSELIDRMLAQRLIGPDPTVSPLPPDCPLALEETLRTCLAFDAGQRFQTGAELAAQLEVCLRPRACDLLHPPAHSWRQLVRRFPRCTILLVALLPNI